MITVDQMALFLSVVHDGSFSAAAKKSGKTQSTVTYAIQTMEALLGITLFDRSAYRPVLTEAGLQLLPRIVRIMQDIGDVTALSHGIAGGLEPSVTIVVDAIYPMEKLVNVLREFQEAFPTVPAGLSVEALGGAFDMVMKKAADIGIVGHVPERYADKINRWPMEPIDFTVVAAPRHPLASIARPLTLDEIKDHVQLVLSDRTTLTNGMNFGVYGTRVWRLADLGAKLAMLRAGLGWGGMPQHLVENDLRDGRLVKIHIAKSEAPLLFSRTKPNLICLQHTVKGPATRWLLEQLARSVPENTAIL